MYKVYSTNPYRSRRAELWREEYFVLCCDRLWFTSLIPVSRQNNSEIDDLHMSYVDLHDETKVTATLTTLLTHSCTHSLLLTHSLTFSGYDLSQHVCILIIQ